MAEKQSGPREGLEGVAEGVKGKAKEVGGTLLGNDELRDEGIAQQDKGESKREVAQKEAEAEKARSEAEVNEARQRSHQGRP
ncbi:microaggregate-binding protein 1 [Nocardia sp. NPDC001965]